jgi:hypothetical protein
LKTQFLTLNIEFLAILQPLFAVLINVFKSHELKVGMAYYNSLFHFYGIVGASFSRLQAGPD